MTRLAVEKLCALALVVVAVCAVVVSSASAQQFHVSKPGALKGKQLNNQVFETGAGTVTCTTATTSGSANAVLSLSILVTAVFVNCTAFGFAEVKINPAQFEISADRGLVRLENLIVIQVPLGGCSVHIRPQDVLEVKFDNTSPRLIILGFLHGILSIGSGGLCGGVNTNGTASGNSEIELVGGTISWA